MSEKTAEDMLAAMADRGNFIVRDSLLPDADYILSLRAGNEIWNYEVCVKPDNECSLYKYSFPDISAVIAFYSENRLGPAYLKPLSEPFVHSVRPALACTIKIAGTVSPPRRVTIAPENLCTMCKDKSSISDEPESPLSPMRTYLSREHSDCNASSVSAYFFDQDRDAHQVPTTANVLAGNFGNVHLNGSPCDRGTSDGIVINSYHTLDTDVIGEGPRVSTAEGGEMVANGRTYYSVELSSFGGQSFSNPSNVLETVAEGQSSSDSENNEGHFIEDTITSKGTGENPASATEHGCPRENEGGHHVEDDGRHRDHEGGHHVEHEGGHQGEDDQNQLTNDLESSAEEGVRGSQHTNPPTDSSVIEDKSHPSTVVEGNPEGSGNGEHVVKIRPEEVEQLNSNAGSTREVGSEREVDVTENSVGKLASNLQAVLAPSSFRGQSSSGRKSKFVSTRHTVPMCPDGIQITQGPVAVMAGTTGPTPSAPPVIRLVKPRTISPDDMDLIAGPINTKRSGKKLKRHKSMFERSDKPF